MADEDEELTLPPLGKRRDENAGEWIDRNG